MAAKTYTDELGAQEQRIESLTEAVSQGYSGLPGVTSALRKQLYEREKALGGLEKENEAKIKELYTADQRYAERYGNPESEMFIEDPMARQGLISGQKADIRGELGNILNLIQSRQQTLGNAMEKGMEMYKAGLKAQELELSQAEKEWNRIWKKYQDDERKKARAASLAKSAKKDQAMAELLRLMGIRKGGWTPDEEKPKVTPSKRGVNYRSPRGQWEWSWEENAWLPSGQEGTQRAEQDFGDFLSEHPEASSFIFENFDEFYPQPDPETQRTDNIISVIRSGGRSIDDLPASVQSDVISRSAELGYNITRSGKIKESSASEPPANLEEEVSAAQERINNYDNPLLRADIYAQIVEDHLDLKPYLKP